MITIFQAIILGFMQGAFELFPVSSLGHSVIFPALVGWNIHENDNSFLIFLIATHLATALVLIGFYWNTWVGITKGLLRSLKARQIDPADSQAKLGWLLIIGTIPAGILGLLFQDQIRTIFVTAQSAAFFLFLNGFVLLAAERLRARAPQDAAAAGMQQRIAKLSWGQGIRVGTSQALALIPGFSRSGASMGGSLLVGLSNKDAANFSFLLATPIILAAGVLKLPELFQASNHALIAPSLIGAICSAISAYLAVRFLTRYFETNSLKPFGYYCIAAGALASIILLLP